MCNLATLEPAGVHASSSVSLPGVGILGSPRVFSIKHEKFEARWGSERRKRRLESSNLDRLRCSSR